MKSKKNPRKPTNLMTRKRRRSMGLTATRASRVTKRRRGVRGV
jgi:hypothetical protein